MFRTKSYGVIQIFKKVKFREIRVVVNWKVESRRIALKFCLTFHFKQLFLVTLWHSYMLLMEKVLCSWKFDSKLKIEFRPRRVYYSNIWNCNSLHWFLYFIIETVDFKIFNINTSCIVYRIIAVYKKQNISLMHFVLFNCHRGKILRYLLKGILCKYLELKLFIYGGIHILFIVPLQYV